METLLPTTMPSSFPTTLPLDSDLTPGQVQTIRGIFAISIPNQASPRSQRQLCFEAVLGACKRGEWEKLEKSRELLNSVRDEEGVSLFQAFIERGMTRTVKQFIERKFYQASACQFPLHCAARYGWLKTVEVLCAHHQINVLDDGGKTPLHHAIEQGQDDVALFLLRKGAALKPVTVQQGEEKLCLHPVGLAVRCGELACVDALLAHDAMMVGIHVEKLGNLLHAAVYFGQHLALRQLLSFHVKGNKWLLEGRDPMGQTPLSLASTRGDLEAVLLLIAAGATVNTQDDEQRAPLHWATLGRHQEIIQVLYQQGARLEMTDAQSNRPIDLLGDSQDTESRATRSLLANTTRRPEIGDPLGGRTFENLVIQGGAPFNAYLGALTQLQARGVIRNVRRTAGTLNGALLAALLAVGYSLREIRALVAQVPVPSSEPLDRKGKQPARRGVQASGCQTNPTTRFLASNGRRTNQRLRDWLQAKIQAKTGRTLTLGELGAQVGPEAPYKHLHISLLDVETGCLVRLSSEEARWKSVSIADAVTAALSIPGIHVPYELMDAAGRKKFGTLLDGSLILDHEPVAYFDKQRYVSSGRQVMTGDCFAYNKRTLALQVDVQPNAESCDPVQEYLVAVSRAHRVKRYNEYRTLDFRISPGDDPAAVWEHGYRRAAQFVVHSPPQLICRNLGLIHIRTGCRHFVGREKLLEALKKKLLVTLPKPRQRALSVVLCGLGGVGKTELACTFANRHLDEFSLVYWVNCTSTEAQQTSYRELATLLKMPLKGSESPEAIRVLVHRRLDNATFEKPWLLIYDSLEEPIDLPQRGGCVIVTSRRRDLEELGETLSVRPFSKEEATAFFEKTLPGQEVGLTEQLAAKLDHLPLMLDKAIAYMRRYRRQITLGSYLQELKSIETTRELLQLGQGRYGRSIVSAFKMSVDRLAQYHPKALDWLNLCAYFSASVIPVSWIERWLKTQNVENLRQERRELFRVLCDHSLVTYDASTESFSLHQLEQEALWQLQSQPKVTYSQAVKFLNALAQHQPHGWARDWLPHAAKVQAHERFQREAPQAQVRLLHSMGLAKAEQLDLTGSLAYHRQALAVADQAQALEPRIRISCSTAISIALARLGKIKESLAVKKRTLELISTAYGDGANDLRADTYQNLSVSYNDVGDYEEARTYAALALSIYDHLAKGKPSKGCAAACTSLGCALKNLKEYEKALKYDLEALKCFQGLYADNPQPVLAGAYMNVGVSLDQLKRLDEALQHKNQAVALYQQLFQDIPHPALASAYASLGSTLRFQKKHRRALLTQQKAVDMFRQIYQGHVHPKMASALNNLGNTQHDLQLYREAIASKKEALALFKKCFGDRPHILIADSLGNLAMSYNANLQFTEAVECYQKKLREYERLGISSEDQRVKSTRVYLKETDRMRTSRRLSQIQGPQVTFGSRCHPLLLPRGRERVAPARGSRSSSKNHGDSPSSPVRRERPSRLRAQRSSRSERSSEARVRRPVGRQGGCGEITFGRHAEKRRTARTNRRAVSDSLQSVSEQPTDRSFDAPTGSDDPYVRTPLVPSLEPPPRKPAVRCSVQ